MGKDQRDVLARLSKDLETRLCRPLSNRRCTGCGGFFFEDEPPGDMLEGLEYCKSCWADTVSKAADRIIDTIPALLYNLRCGRRPRKTDVLFVGELLVVVSQLIEAFNEDCE